MPLPAKTSRGKALTPKQWRFVEAFNAQPLAERDANAAAVEAGYSKRGLSKQVAKLLKSENVRAHILEGTSEDVRKVTQLSHVDQAWVLRELHDLWETPISALLNDDGSVKPINEIPPNAQKLIAGFKVRRVRERTGEVDNLGRPVFDDVEITEIKLIDRFRVLETIGKTTHVNAFGTREEAEAKEGFARLMGAMSRAASRGDTIDVESKKVNQ